MPLKRHPRPQAQQATKSTPSQARKKLAAATLGQLTGLRDLPSLNRPCAPPQSSAGQVATKTAASTPHPGSTSSAATPIRQKAAQPRTLSILTQVEQDHAHSQTSKQAQNYKPSKTLAKLAAILGPLAMEALGPGAPTVTGPNAADAQNGLSVGGVQKEPPGQGISTGAVAGAQPGATPGLQMGATPGQSMGSTAPGQQPPQSTGQAQQSTGQAQAILAGFLPPPPSAGTSLGQPAQPAGNSPTTNPINHYGALSTSGVVDGNAGLGVAKSALAPVCACPFCGAAAYAGDPETGTKYRGSGQCGTCRQTFSLVALLRGKQAAARDPLTVIMDVYPAFTGRFLPLAAMRTRPSLALTKQALAGTGLDPEVIAARNRFNRRRDRLVSLYAGVPGYDLQGRMSAIAAAEREWMRNYRGAGAQSAVPPVDAAPDNAIKDISTRENTSLTETLPVIRNRTPDAFGSKLAADLFASKVKAYGTPLKPSAAGESEIEVRVVPHTLQGTDALPEERHAGYHRKDSRVPAQSQPNRGYAKMVGGKLV